MERPGVADWGGGISELNHVGPAVESKPGQNGFMAWLTALRGVPDLAALPHVDLLASF
jgi:hypothetical protein